LSNNVLECASPSAGVSGKSHTPAKATLAGVESLERLIYDRLKPVMPQLEKGYNGGLHQCVMDLVERPLIRLVLEQTQGNQCRAAEVLGINRNTLRKKILQLGLHINSNP